MLSLNIHFIDQIAELTGRKEINVQVKEDATLSDVFTEIGEKYGEGMKKKFIAPSGEIHSHILVAVNGIEVRGLNGISTRLNHGDEIQVALHIVGG